MQQIIHRYADFYTNGDKDGVISVRIDESGNIAIDEKEAPWRLPSQRGFTLLEVLMALAILAGTGIAILGVTGEIIRQTPILEQRTLARMVAKSDD